VSTIENEVVSTETPAAGEVSLARRVVRPQTLVSFAIGVVILVFGLKGLQIDVPATLRVVGSANWLFFLGAFVVYYCTFPIRALRWRVMLENAGCARKEIPRIPGLSEIIYLSWFANSVVPAKLGDVYRAYLLRRRSTVSLSKGGGTIVAERLIDFAVLMLLLVGSGLLSFRGKLPGTVVAVLEVGAVGLVLAVVALLAMHRLDSIVRRFIPGRLHRIYDHFHDGTLGSFGNYPQLLTLTLLAWVAETGRFFLVTRSVGLVLSPNPVLNLLIVTFIALGAALLTAPPGTPAGLGYVEASISGALILFGANRTFAVSVALLDRTISFLSLVVFGFIVYLLSYRHADRI
jgi:uncharacterized protein (TIRG00374 family)